MKKILTALTLSVLAATAAQASEGHIELKKSDWSFTGPRAHWDTMQILRGYEVATQVCISCHSFKYFSHRNLTTAGFTEDQAKALAGKMDMDVNQKLLSGLTAEDSKETYGLVVPDLSVMAKARHGGPDYIYSILTGYEEAPAGVDVGNGNYNKYFPGHVIAMPAPLSDGQVTYSDGTEATLEQMAHDVATFIAFISEPERVERQQMGVYVLIYLVIFTALAYVLKCAIWRDIKKKS